MTTNFLLKIFKILQGLRCSLGRREDKELNQASLGFECEPLITELFGMEDISEGEMWDIFS